jgi:DNA end-binding protein Ku
MPRAIWSGAITFGLVNVPVRMYSAIREHSLHFHYIHEKDSSPIGYSKVCKAEERPVPDDEIIKAFEWEKGEYVPMSEEDFAAAEPEAPHKAIEIRDFVDYEQIDPVYFERTYYLVPSDGAEKAYSLLVKAMEESGRAAIAKYVMRDRQNLGCLRVREGVITLERMHFADEIVSLDELVPESQQVDSRELEMANSLIDRLTSDFDPSRYADTYRDALCEIIKAKREGETVKAPKLERARKVPDLMAALEESLKRAKEGDGRNGKGDLKKLSKDELYEMAKARDVPGRADMSKDELLEALSDVTGARPDGAEAKKAKRR